MLDNKLPLPLRLLDLIAGSFPVVLDGCLAYGYLHLSTDKDVQLIARQRLSCCIEELKVALLRTDRLIKGKTWFHS